MREKRYKLIDLPDEIVIRILTFLPTTKDAVTLCLGVSHFLDLWRYLPRLAFDSFEDSVDFVENVMHLRDCSVPLESLYLNFSDSTKNEEDRCNVFLICLDNIFPCNVEELTLVMHDFDYDIYTRGMSPYSDIFWCRSLVKLDLHCITVGSLVISLPRLKYLKLSRVRFHVADSTLGDLLSSPLLEILILDDCYWWEPVHASSPNLQVLKITVEMEELFTDADICIVAKNLKYFSYMGILIKEKYQIFASSSTQLDKVEIYVDEEMIVDFGLNCYEILKGLSKTRNLALSDYFLEGIQNFPDLLDTVPSFDCLTRLDIQVYKKVIYIDSLTLMKIYERCPHLECLNIGKLGQTVGSPQLNPIPLCFQTSLKKIMVHYYIVPGDDGADDEADAAIDVLLNSALVLEELIIYCQMDSEYCFIKGHDREIQKLQDKFNKRPRISKDCIISIRATFFADMPGLLEDGYYSDCYLESLNE